MAYFLNVCKFPIVQYGSSANDANTFFNYTNYQPNIQILNFWVKHYYNLSPINQCLALKSYFKFIFKYFSPFFLSRTCANDKWHKKKHLFKPNEASKSYIYLNLCDKNKVKANQNIQTYSCVWSSWQEDILFHVGILANLRRSIIFKNPLNPALPPLFFHFFSWYY